MMVDGVRQSTYGRASYVREGAVLRTVKELDLSHTVDPNRIPLPPSHYCLLCLVVDRPIGLKRPVLLAKPNRTYSIS